MIIKCPKCKKKMALMGRDSTENTREGKKYSRDIYSCKKHDIWVTVENPA